MFGLPQTILVENGPEFHGEALTRRCAEYGIELLDGRSRDPVLELISSGSSALPWAASIFFRGTPGITGRVT